MRQFVFSTSFHSGFGMLKMRDGSYYEGQFQLGEITGTGCRYWSHSGNYYEGNFEAGEMTGQGVMRFGDGRLYEGSWKRNIMDGNNHWNLISLFFSCSTSWCNLRSHCGKLNSYQGALPPIHSFWT